MGKVMSITDEQRAQLRAYAREQIALALRTASLTEEERREVEEGYAQCYRAAGIPWHGEVVWVDSPRAAVTEGPRRAAAISGTDPVAAIKEGWRRYLGGAGWQGWRAWRLALVDICGVQIDPEIEERIRAEARTSAAWWAWAHRQFLVISDRPAEIRTEDMDGTPRLHCETGPSMLWRDGWALYHWHGTAVPREWIEGTPAATEVLAATDIEQRRAGCEIITQSREVAPWRA